MPFTQTQIHMDGYNSKIIDLVAYTIYVSALQLAHVVFHGLAKVLACSFFLFCYYKVQVSEHKNTLVFKG